MNENIAKAYAAMRYQGSLGSAGAQAAPQQTMSDRIAGFSASLNDANQQMAEVLSRIYGPQPENTENEGATGHCMMGNLEAVEKQIDRLNRYVKLMHNIA